MYLGARDNASIIMYGKEKKQKCSAGRVRCAGRESRARAPETIVGRETFLRSAESVRSLPVHPFNASPDRARVPVSRPVSRHVPESDIFLAGAIDSRRTEIITRTANKKPRTDVNRRK